MLGAMKERLSSQRVDAMSCSADDPLDGHSDPMKIAVLRLCQLAMGKTSDGSPDANQVPRAELNESGIPSLVVSEDFWERISN